MRAERVNELRVYMLLLMNIFTHFTHLLIKPDTQVKGSFHRLSINTVITCLIHLLLHITMLIIDDQSSVCLQNNKVLSSCQLSYLIETQYYGMLHVKTSPQDICGHLSSDIIDPISHQ